MSDTEIAAYEGLVRTTASRYVPFLDDDFEDIAQVLRLKIWKALQAFDPAKATQSIEGYVFMCMRNQVKDLLKGQDRRNRARGGATIFIEDASGGNTDRFQEMHMSASQEQAFFTVEDEAVELPATLTDLETKVVGLLLLDLNQTEIATAIGVTRQRVRTAHLAVQEKMLDWRPDSAETLANASLLAARRSREANDAHVSSRAAQAA